MRHAKQQHTPRPVPSSAGTPLSVVRFRSVQTFGARRRAIEINTTREGWASDAVVHWMPHAVQVRFSDGTVYLVGHAAVETAEVKTGESETALAAGLASA